MSGLPRPLVFDLLPRLPSAQAYSPAAELYDADSIYRARIAVQMLRVGLRLNDIRAALAQPMALVMVLGVALVLL